MMFRKVIQVVALLSPVVAFGSVDFARPGCLEMNRGAFADGGEQIAFSSDGATVSLDATRVKAGQGVYYSIKPRGADDDTWANRRVSVFVRFHKPDPVLPSLSIEFHDADGEAFRYKPVKARCLDGLTRLDYHVVEKGVCTDTWGPKVNHRFDGKLRFAGLLGSYRSKTAAGTLTYVKLETSDLPAPTADLVVDVETGDQLHLIRGGCGEAALTLKNTSAQTHHWTGRAVCRDHFDNSFAVPVDVTVGTGATGRVSLGDRAWRKGIWYVFAELKDEAGRTCEFDTRFAAVDRHDVTPVLQKPHFRMGINYHAQHYWKDENFAKTLDALVASGAKLVRSGGFKFVDVAPKGPDDWTMTDAIYKALRERGFAINANVYPAPAWSRKPMPDKMKKLPHRYNWPTQDGLFRSFCERIASRYRGGIDYFEMGNEWDLTSREILPETEALRLVREGHDGIKAGDPAATVITCGWAGATTADFEKAPNPGLIEAFAEKAQDAFDVWALHIHGLYDTYETGVKERFFPLRARTMPKKPWYSNETAITTAGGNEPLAARTVWMKILSAWAWGSTDYIWYNLREIGPNDSERGFGLVTADYHPRATFAAFAALTALLEGGRFDSVLSERGTRHLYRFQAPDGRSLVVAGWDADCEETLAVMSDAQRAYAVDLMGNRTELKGNDGVFAWTVGENPSAVLFEGATRAELRHTRSLLFREADLPTIRKRLAEDKDAKAWWTDFRRHAQNAYLRHPTEIPPRGAQWYHYYSCRKCGTHLKAASPTEHVCPSCGERHAGWPYDDAYLFGRQHRAANAALDCALVYALDGSRDFGEKACDYLRAYATKYESYELHNNSASGLYDKHGKRNMGLAKAFSQPLDEAVWLIRLVQAYDCVADLLSAADRALVKDHLIRPAVKVIKAQSCGIHNHECWHLSAYGLAGLALEDPALVDEAIHSKLGLLQQLEKGVRSDNCWFEGAWGYHFYTMAALEPFVTALVNRGIPPPAAYKRLFDAPFGQVTPNWKLPAVNDCARLGFARGDKGELYERAWTWWRDDTYAWWLAARPRTTRAYALGGTPLSENRRAAPAFGSVNYGATGFAVLRSRTPGAKTDLPDNYVAVDFGPYGGGHEHPDKLNLLLYAHGEMLAEDPGCINYGNSRHWQWYKASLAHNEPVMDGKNQRYTAGKCLFFDKTENRSCACFDAGEAYPGARVRRAVAFVDDVVLDLVTVASPASHDWEWAFHCRGKVEPSVPTAELMLPPPDEKSKYGFGREADGTDAWRWTTQVREGRFDGTWSANWRKPDGTVSLGLVQRVVDLKSGQPLAGRLRTAIGSAQPPPETFDLAVPGVTGGELAFATVMTPGRAAAEVSLRDVVRADDGSLRLACEVGGKAFRLVVTADGKVTAGKNR